MATGISSPLALSGLFASVDGRYVAANGKPFTSVDNAESALNGFPSKLSESCVGLTVLVKASSWPKAKEYWVQPKGTTPETYGLVEKCAGTTDYEDLDNKPTIGDGSNTALPIVGNVKVSASTASGENAGVSVTQGQTAGEIEMNFTLPKGADGANGQNGITPSINPTNKHWMTGDTDTGVVAEGQDGAPGQDAINPFKGWYDSLEGLQTAVGSPAVGDYAYIKGATASDPAAIYECATAGSWSNSGRTVDTSNVQTFETGQPIHNVRIVNDDGTDAGNNSDVLSSTAGLKLQTIDRQLNGREKNIQSYGSMNAYGVNRSNTANDSIERSEFIPITLHPGDVIEFTDGVTRTTSEVNDYNLFLFSSNDETIWVGEDSPNNVNICVEKFGLKGIPTSKTFADEDSYLSAVHYFRIVYASKIDGVDNRENVYVKLNGVTVFSPTEGEDGVFMKKEDVVVDETQLANPATDALAKAKDTALLNAKVGDMEYTEVKAENYTPVSGKVQGDGTIAPQDTALYAEIPVDTYDGARFLGVNLANSSNTTTKNTGFCFGHYEDGAFVVDESKYYSATAASSVNKEYTVAKPSGATHIRVNVKYSTLTQSTFYCYLYNGKNIATSIKDIEKQLIIYTEKKSVRVNGLSIGESTSQVIESSNNAIRYYLARKGERTRCYAREDSLGRIRAATSTEVPEVGTAVNIKLFGTNKHKDAIAAGTILYDIVPDVDTYILYQTSVAYVDNVVYDVEGTIGDIVARLESNSGDEADQTEKLFAASKFTDKHSDPYKESLTLLHFSDIHGATNNLQRIVDYNTKWSEYIDGMICTGDMVANTYADGNIFVNSNVAGSENVMLVIGNHDTGQLINGAIDWFAKIDTQDAYDRYMGNSASWGIVQPSGAGENGYYPCYYYKDYAAKKVRLIVLDLMKMVKDLDDGVQDENNLQLDWFTSTINDAITLGYHVMVAEHFPFIVKSNVYTVNAEAIQSDFTLLGHSPSGIANGQYDRHRGEALDKLSAIVEGFKSNGGRFICWLCGHTHYDHFDRVLNTDQKVIVIGTASIVNDKNTIRNADDESADLFNVLSVNTYNRVVKVFRVGSHLSPALQRIETMSFEY